MPQVPLLTPKDAIRVFESFGWQWVRTRGSHAILTCAGRYHTLAIPLHERVGRGLLRDQIRKAVLLSNLTLDLRKCKSTAETISSVPRFALAFWLALSI
jgi:predicted RNA binding protein YcfA (HicA-like mRNA interferase family)